MSKTQLALAALCLLSLAGCHSSAPEFPSAKLEGSVTLEGVPVESGRVNFMPASGAAGHPVSADIQAGRYAADEVPLGDVTVTFAITKQTGEMINEGSREPYPKIISIVPPRYAAGIVIDVTGDNAAQDFSLVSK